MLFKHNSRTNSIRAVMVVTFGVAILLSSPVSLQAKNESKSQPSIFKLATPPTPPSPSVTPNPVTPPTPPNPGPKNHAPVITTRHFPTGKVGKIYAAYVSATDRDGDKLKMDIYNLPKELVLGSCKTSKFLGRSFITCVVSGKPKNKFSGTVTVAVNDSRDGVTKKDFKLQIK